MTKHNMMCETSQIPFSPTLPRSFFQILFNIRSHLQFRI